MIRRLRFGTERARLTALYTGLILLAGGLLTAFIYSLVQRWLEGPVQRAAMDTKPTGMVAPFAFVRPVRLPSTEMTRTAAFRIQSDAVEVVTGMTLSRLLIICVIGFGVFSVLSAFLAWWMAGRVLRPVGVITATANKLSGENLAQRIDLKGPPGELKQLADTFDRMLDRIERLVQAQQRFAANAAHELRTPLAIQRAAAEIGLSDPRPEEVQWIRRRLIDTADSSERLIESLLLFADAAEGLRHREAVALDRTTEAVVAEAGEEARQRGITLTTVLKPLAVEGDPVLLGQLIRNLVRNALRYNHPGGEIRIVLGDGTLRITNTGPHVPAGMAPRLFEPFHRLQARTRVRGEGAGLGLAIVAAIARAHGGTATADPRPGGGLTVTVEFP